jgi:hypothetical protein
MRSEIGIALPRLLSSSKHEQEGSHGKPTDYDFISEKKVARSAALKTYVKGAPKKAAGKLVATNRAASPSKAAIMLHDLRPSVEALYDRVEKLRLRFS